MTAHYPTFTELRDRWEPTPISQQLANIREWAGSSALPPQIGRLAAKGNVRLDDVAGSDSELTVVTPNLGSTHKTALALWRIVAKRFDGSVFQRPPFDQDPDVAGSLLITGIDEELPASAKIHPQSLAHRGPAVLPRMPNSLSASVIDIDASIGDTNGLGNAVAPFTVRDAATAPHVELLAMLAHQPDMAELIGSGDGPWMWVPGMHINDTRGNITAQTPLISGGDHELRVQGVWNDGGVPFASIPVFNTAPHTIAA